MLECWHWIGRLDEDLYWIGVEMDLKSSPDETS